MIIYNTTFVVHPEVEAAALDWIKNTYKTAAISKGGAQGAMLTRILAYADDAISYALHLEFDDIEAAENWDSGLGASFRKILATKWGDKVLTFQTYMEKVE